MPWRTTCAMRERILFVADYINLDVSFAELCRRYGISRQTGYKWLERFGREGVGGLEDKSRVPLGNSRSTGEEVRKQLLVEKKKHPHWGARKLLVELEKEHPGQEFPSASTLHRVLEAEGKVAKRPRRRASLCESRCHVAPDAPNTVWGVDYKGQFLLGDGSWCYPLTITDSFSRYLLCCRGMPRIDTEEAWTVFEEVFEAYGLPEVILSDNGPPFASSGAGRLTRFSVRLLKQGIVLDRIRPGRPQENGRHERMHRTLKAEATLPASVSLLHQQLRFNLFQEEYNHKRPHEALGQIPPGEVYTPSPRPYVRNVGEAEYPEHFEVRRVRQSGEIKFRGGIHFLSTALVGERVGLFEVEDGIWWVAFTSHHVAQYNAATGKLHPVKSGAGRSKIGFIA